MTNYQRLQFTAAAVLIAVGIGAGAVKASERRPLPPLTVKSLDGQAVDGPAITRQGNWLLLYVEPGCGSCAAVLSAISAEDHPGLAERITVIVGGATFEQAAALASASELGAAKWVLDSDRSARAALNIKQVPMSIGMRSTMIEWTLTGALRGPDLTSVLVTWLKQPVIPQ
jgi:hypothetical protein